MGKYILEFSKKGDIVFTSHLDLMRSFIRGFKRSKIKVKYSQGFNPHPKMNFAQPLSLGYEAEAELLEFETEGELNTDSIPAKLNEVLPTGISVFSCREVKEQRKSISAQCTSALYRIIIPLNEDQIRISEEIVSRIESIFDRDEIPVEKKRKKGKPSVELNIKPMINNISVHIIDNNIIMECHLRAGSAENLSPELLLTGLNAHLTDIFPRETIEITRLKLLF